MEEDLSVILELQSPFRWKPLIRDENRHEFDLEQEDAGTFSFLNFCVRIIRIYDEYKKTNKTSGHELLKNVDERLQQLENCKDDLYVKCKDAIHHVFLACKTQIAIFDNNYGDEVKQWVKSLTKFDEMNASNKSAMCAIKACVHSLYSNDALDTSLSQINMALAHDKSIPYWMFLKGCILQRLRPTNEVPSLQEREAFEAAFNNDSSNPLFMVYFADCLRETCKYKPKTYLWFIAESARVNPAEKVNEKLEKALQLYRKGYELKPNCPVIAFKSANGLMRLPPKYQDAKLIKKIISECEPKFPESGFGNLVCALYHERISKKLALSQRCLKKCIELNVFSGCMNAIRNAYVGKEETNVVERLEKMLDVFGEPARQEIIIAQIISYYVFVMVDIEKACEYMLKYYRKKSNGCYLEKHQSCFRMTDGPISLVDVITDQVKIKLRDGKLPKEKRKFYNDFVRQMNFHNVDVLKGNPKNLLEQIQKAAVPKNKNPNQTHSNEAQRNSSSQNRQLNDRTKYGPRNDDFRRREDAPRDRRGAGNASRENVPRNYASPRRFDDRHPGDRRADHRPASFDKRPNRGGGQTSSSETAQKINASPRRLDDRRPEDRRVDNRPATFDKRPNNRGFEGRNANAETLPGDNASAGRSNDRPVEERSARPTSSGDRSAVVKTKARKSDSEYRMLMDMCKEGSQIDLDAIFNKWKLMSLKESQSEVSRTEPEEAKHKARGNRRLEDHRSEDRRRDRSRSEASDHSRRPEHRKPDEAQSEQSRRLEDGSKKDRRRDRSLSKGSDRSRRHKHRHRKPSETKDGSLEDRSRGRSLSKASDRSYRHRKPDEAKDGSLEDRRRDRSLSKASDRSHRHKHRHRKPDEAKDSSLEGRRRDRSMSKASDRSHRHKQRHRKSNEVEDGSVEDRRRDRSLSKASNRSHRHKHRHSKHKKHRHSSRSEDERSRHRSETPSRKHRSHKSHRKHRRSESVSDSEKSVSRHKSHRKHRNSESASGSERSEHSRHRSKRHLSTEGHREKHRSHREKSSRPKKESRRGHSDSEGSDSR